MAFGTDSALHYNFFSLILAVLANLILGNPMANYFDDLGSMSKSSISEEALATFSDFCRILAVLLNDKKSGL